MRSWAVRRNDFEYSDQPKRSYFAYILYSVDGALAFSVTVHTSEPSAYVEML